MNIAVGNISYSRAIVSWSSSEPCQEDYYHVMYRPNWNSLFSSYLRYSFHHEEKVPRTISRVRLDHLAPSTFYFLCVSCKKITFPHNHYCTMFHTLDKTPLSASKYFIDPQVSMWILLAILLSCFTAVLAFVCIQFWCARCYGPSWAYRGAHMEEANGLVRWTEDGPALGPREDDQQGLPLMEMARRDSGAGAEPEAEADQGAPNQDVPDAGAPRREGGSQPGIPPHFEQ